MELSRRGIEQVDGVVSSLGISFMDMGSVDALFRPLLSHLGKRGTITQFQYVTSRCVQKHKRTQDRRAGAVSIVINPWRAQDLGVGGDVGDSSSPYAQGKHRPARDATLPSGNLGPGPGCTWTRTC